MISAALFPHPGRLRRSCVSGIRILPPPKAQEMLKSSDSTVFTQQANEVSNLHSPEKPSVCPSTPAIAVEKPSAPIGGPTEPPKVSNISNAMSFSFPFF